jgi:hypothetical protein
VGSGSREAATAAACIAIDGGGVGGGGGGARRRRRAAAAARSSGGSGGGGGARGGGGGGGGGGWISGRGRGTPLATSGAGGRAARGPPQRAASAARARARTRIWSTAFHACFLLAARSPVEVRLSMQSFLFDALSGPTC